jgi:hypothetical protein
MTLRVRFDTLDGEAGRRPRLGRLARRRDDTLWRWRHGFLAGVCWLTRRWGLSRGLLVWCCNRARNVTPHHPTLAIWTLKDIATLGWHGGSGEQNDQRYQSRSPGEKPGIVSYVHQRKGHACTKHTLARYYCVHQALSR